MKGDTIHVDCQSMSKYVKVCQSVIKICFPLCYMDIRPSAMIILSTKMCPCIYPFIHLSTYRLICLSTCPILSCPVLSCPFVLFYPILLFLLSYLILSVLSILSILSYPILPYLTLSYLSYLSHLISSHLILSVYRSFLLSVCLSIYLRICLSTFYLFLPLCHSQHETKHAREHLRKAQARFKYLQIIKVITFSVMTCQFLVCVNTEYGQNYIKLALITTFRNSMFR